MTFRILTVCTGNMCRSPLAERLIAARAAEHDLAVAVSSAGTHARNGEDLHPETARLCMEMGADPSEFSSRLITAGNTSGTDLTLTAETSHRDAVQQLVPTLWKRVFTLREFELLARASPHTDVRGLARQRRSVTEERLDIEDPIGKSIDVFNRTGNEISVAVEAVIRFLVQRRDTSFKSW